MKKLFVVLVWLLILLTGCGSNNSNSDLKIEVQDFYGTWVSYKIKEDGSFYTVDELAKLGNDKLKDFYLVVKEGGNAFVYSEPLSMEQNKTWAYEEEDSSIMIESMVFTLDGNNLIWTNEDGSMLYLKKYSYSQDITKIPSSNIEEEKAEQEIVSSDDNVQIIEETDSNDRVMDQNDIRPEIKEAIDSYEKFIDEYCAFMIKYCESDGTDTGILADYASFLSKYSEMESKMDKLSDDLTDAEALYYSEVMLRCSHKLLEVMY